MPVRYCSSKLKVGPIKSYLAAVHNLHVTQGIPGAPLDQNPMLALVLQEIERKQAKQERNREDARQPKTPALLRVLRADWNERLGHYEATLLWTAACAGFFACLCPEFTVESLDAFNPAKHLTAMDVVVNSREAKPPQRIRLNIKFSKT